MRYVGASAMLAAVLLISACESEERPRAAVMQEGREETRGIRNTEAIGYAGDAVADRVDAALDANDRRREQLDDALNAAE